MPASPLLPVERAVEASSVAVLTSTLDRAVQQVLKASPLDHARLTRLALQYLHTHTWVRTLGVTGWNASLPSARPPRIAPSRDGAYRESVRRLRDRCGLWVVPRSAGHAARAVWRADPWVGPDAQPPPLLMECPRGNLSQAMRHLGLVFTQAYNRANRREGALWRGRYHNRVVLDDAYLRFLLAPG